MLCQTMRVRVQEEYVARIQCNVRSISCIFHAVVNYLYQSYALPNRKGICILAWTLCQKDLCTILLQNSFSSPASSCTKLTRLTHPTPRLALRYTPNVKLDALHVSATGTGGLSEFTSTLPSDDAVFGFVRVNIGNDEYSQRAKFVFVRWCGPETKVMRKAKLGIHSGEVTSVIRTYAVEIQTDETRDLAEDRVMTLVRKAMGANCESVVVL